MSGVGCPVVAEKMGSKGALLRMELSNASEVSGASTGLHGAAPPLAAAAGQLPCQDGAGWSFSQQGMPASSAFAAVAGDGL